MTIWMKPSTCAGSRQNSSRAKFPAEWILVALDPKRINNGKVDIPTEGSVIASPFSFGPSFLVTGLSVAPPFGLECLTSLTDVRSTMPSADFCPPGRSPEVSSAAFHAQPPDIRFACLMDTDFAVTSLLVPRSRLLSGSCSSTRVFAPRFLQTPIMR